MKTRNKHSSLDRFTRRVRLVLARGVARIGLSVAFVGCLASISLCCSIPVFRYALEHWHPELFLVHVISPSPLDAGDISLLQELQASSGSANVRWVLSDGKVLSSQGLKSVVDKAYASQAVWMAVESTKKTGDSRQLIWDSPFNKEAALRLLRSPVRDRVCQGLVDKDSVAWIFLESGKVELDNAKFAKIEAELHRLEQVIKLPVIEEADLKDLSKRPEDLKVKFSAHRLSRTDPSEAAFISMLLSTESDLQEEFENGMPMAFPVFGRGRVLYALLGDGIAASTIEEACRFLAGACQCTVKAENPGVDLLASFDWDAHVQITEPKKADDLPFTGLGSFAPTPSESEPKVSAGLTKTASDRIEQSETKTSSSAQKLNVDSELGYELPKQTSTPSSTWITLGVLAAIIGIATVGWKFLAGTNP